MILIDPKAKVWSHVVQWWEQNLLVFGKRINALYFEFGINNKTKVICTFYYDLLYDKCLIIARSWSKMFKTLVGGSREKINSLSVEVAKVEVLHQI